MPPWASPRMTATASSACVATSRARRWRPIGSRNGRMAGCCSPEYHLPKRGSCKTRWRDGTTHIAMERSELIDRLAPLIPPPRAHQVRYHGILAPSASLRSRVVPVQEFDLDRPAATDDASGDGAGVAASLDPSAQLQPDSN